MPCDSSLRHQQIPFPGHLGSGEVAWDLECLPRLHTQTHTVEESFTPVTSTTQRWFPRWRGHTAHSYSLTTTKAIVVHEESISLRRASPDHDLYPRIGRKMSPTHSALKKEIGAIHDFQQHDVDIGSKYVLPRSVTTQISIYESPRISKNPYCIILLRVSGVKRHSWRRGYGSRVRVNDCCRGLSVDAAYLPGQWVQLDSSLSGGRRILAGLGPEL